MSEKPRYGTWIRVRAVVIFAALTSASALLSLLALWSLWALAFLVPALVFGWILVVVGLSAFRFSNAGGGFQARVHSLLVERAEGSPVLDIGCGNGHLSIELARSLEGRQVTGLDFWGAAWEYSKAACERNASLEGVAEWTTFIQGPAAALPFPAEAFHCVVSCLVFHEVKDQVDKTVALGEAMRVLAKGGRFVFFDLFSDRGAFPDYNLVRERIREHGGEIEEDVGCSELLPLPFPLGSNKVLGHARLLAGTKLA